MEEETEQLKKGAEQPDQEVGQPEKSGGTPKKGASASNKRAGASEKQAKAAARKSGFPTVKTGEPETHAVTPDVEAGSREPGSENPLEEQADQAVEEVAEDAKQKVADAEDANDQEDQEEPENEEDEEDEEDEEEPDMTFWDHLEDLRWSLVRVAGILIVVLIGCFSAMPYLFEHFVLAPTTSDFFLYRWLSGLGGGTFLPNFSNSNYAVEIININVASQFLTHISTSFWFALVLIFPYLTFELWRFVQPALFAAERRNVGLAFLGGTLMFFLGCAVGYGVVFPFTFRFLTEYQLSPSIENQISLNSYMDNFLMLTFLMGIVFELPLLAWLLSKLGLVTKSFLRKYRRHAAVVLALLAALITPTGDPFTLMIVFLPLYLLYELGIVVMQK